MSRPRPVSAVLLRHAYLLRGSLSRVFPLFAWVAIDMVLWGFLTRYLGAVTAVNFVPIFLGAILLWDFFIRVMQGVTMLFFEDVWSRNFLNIFAAPVTVEGYLGGLVVSSVATSAVGLAVMAVLAGPVFGFSFGAYGLWILPFLFVLFLFGITLGVLGCAMVLRWGPAAEWFIWPLPAFVSPFVGVFYPLSVLPAWMRAVSAVLPPAYVFEGLRSIVAGQRADLSNLWIGAGLAVLWLLGGLAVFRAVFRRAVRTGLLARYSAESVS